MKRRREKGEERRKEEIVEKKYSEKSKRKKFQNLKKLRGTLPLSSAPSIFLFRYRKGLDSFFNHCSVVIRVSRVVFFCKF